MAEKPDERLGAKKTFLLAIGGFLGVVAMNGIIHIVRQGNSTGRKP